MCLVLHHGEGSLCSRGPHRCDTSLLLIRARLTEKKNPKKNRDTCSVPVFLGSPGDTYHREGNGLTSKSTIHVITNLSKHQKSLPWLLMQRHTHKTHFSVQQRTKKKSTETRTTGCPLKHQYPSVVVPAHSTGFDWSALYASKGLCFSKQVRRGPLTAYKDGQRYHDITLVWK